MTTTAENPLVSLIVRTKDRPKLLLKSLRSIAAQDYRPIEVILVNDGGCDLDVGALRTLLGNITLNYIRLEENTGTAHLCTLTVSAEWRRSGFKRIFQRDN